MLLPKIISGLGVIFMTLGLLNGFLNGDFFNDGALLFENPWGIMSLIDLYVGFILFSMWIVFREDNKFIAFLWVMLTMILGFFTGALYVFIKLFESKGSWKVFFLGNNHEHLS
jgi:hypothetical protein